MTRGEPQLPLQERIRRCLPPGMTGIEGQEPRAAVAAMVRQPEDCQVADGTISQVLKAWKTRNTDFRERSSSATTQAGLANQQDTIAPAPRAEATTGDLPTEAVQEGSEGRPFELVVADGRVLLATEDDVIDIPVRRRNTSPTNAESPNCVWKYIDSPALCILNSPRM